MSLSLLITCMHSSVYCTNVGTKAGAAFGNHEWAKHLLPSEQRTLNSLREYTETETLESSMP